MPVNSSFWHVLPVPLQPFDRFTDPEEGAAMTHHTSAGSQLAANAMVAGESSRSNPHASTYGCGSIIHLTCGPDGAAVRRRTFADCHGLLQR
jgi:hypothetical protein